MEADAAGEKSPIGNDDVAASLLCCTLQWELGGWRQCNPSSRRLWRHSPVMGKFLAGKVGAFDMQKEPPVQRPSQPICVTCPGGVRSAAAPTRKLRPIRCHAVVSIWAIAKPARINGPTPLREIVQRFNIGVVDVVIKRSIAVGVAAAAQKPAVSQNLREAELSVCLHLDQITNQSIETLASHGCAYLSAGK